MFEVPFHPKIVHVPIALSMLMPLVTIGLVVAWFEDWLPPHTWWVAIGLQAILFAGSWFAMESGETDEEVVEEVVSEEAVHEHEERAEVFFWATGGVLALMIVPMAVPGARRKRWLAVVGTAGTVVVFWLGARVGEAGGELVYEEGAAGAHVEQVASGGSNQTDERETDDDED